MSGSIWARISASEDAPSAAARMRHWKLLLLPHSQFCSFPCYRHIAADIESVCVPTQPHCKAERRPVYCGSSSKDSLRCFVCEQPSALPALPAARAMFAQALWKSRARHGERSDSSWWPGGTLSSAVGICGGLHRGGGERWGSPAHMLRAGWDWTLRVLESVEEKSINRLRASRSFSCDSVIAVRGSFTSGTGIVQSTAVGELSSSVGPLLGD